MLILLVSAISLLLVSAVFNISDFVYQHMVSDISRLPWERQVKIYEKRKDYNAIAKVYEKMGNYISAAHAYKKGNYDSDYISALHRHLEQEKERNEQRDVILSVAWDIACYYLEKDDYDQFSGALSKEGFPLEAPRYLDKIGQPLKAAHFYASAGFFDEAAKVCVRENEWKAAARYFESGGNFKEAASYYSFAEEWHDAARCFEACEQYLSAASMYEKAKDWERAASLYKSIRDYARSARINKTLNNSIESQSDYRDYCLDAIKFPYFDKSIVFYHLEKVLHEPFQPKLTHIYFYLGMLDQFHERVRKYGRNFDINRILEAINLSKQIDIGLFDWNNSIDFSNIIYGIKKSNDIAKTSGDYSTKDILQSIVVLLYPYISKVRSDDYGISLDVGSTFAMHTVPEKLHPLARMILTSGKNVKNN